MFLNGGLRDKGKDSFVAGSTKPRGEFHLFSFRVLMPSSLGPPETPRAKRIRYLLQRVHNFHPDPGALLSEYRFLVWPSTTLMCASLRSCCNIAISLIDPEPGVFECNGLLAEVIRVTGGQGQPKTRSSLSRLKRVNRFVTSDPSSGRRRTPCCPPSRHTPPHSTRRARTRHRHR